MKSPTGFFTGGGDWITFTAAQRLALGVAAKSHNGLVYSGINRFGGCEVRVEYATLVFLEKWGLGIILLRDRRWALAPSEKGKLAAPTEHWQELRDAAALARRMAKAKAAPRVAPGVALDDGK